MTFATHKRNRLPHWDVAHGIQFVTWHLADALPKPAIERLRLEQQYERQRLLATTGVVTKADVTTMSLTFRRQCERLLDQSQGTCLLRDPAAAEVVADTITYFDGERFRLFAWCVMPNHVHVVFSTELPLAQVVHSWKSYTSKLLALHGKVWQDDYFDRLVRNEGQLKRTVEYVLNNPIKAGLNNWPFVRAYPERL